ncbi:MAG: hypothetical protein ACR2N3_14670 [Pyrinomonadaceae bacterium]
MFYTDFEHLIGMPIPTTIFITLFWLTTVLFNIRSKSFKDLATLHLGLYFIATILIVIINVLSNMEGSTETNKVTIFAVVLLFSALTLKMFFMWKSKKLPECEMR